MTSITLPAYDWAPRAHQMRGWNALASGVSTAVLAWHRRAGKDEIALHNAAIKAMQRVGNYWHLLPMQEQARRALWESVNPKTGRVRWKDAFPDEIIQHVDNQGMKVTFKNGSTWQLLGSDNYNCFSADTEVLTDNGWCLFSDLTGFEKVATLDDGKLVYAPIDHIVQHPFDGEMYQVKNSSIDLLTTPNHRFFVESTKGVRKFKRIDDPTILGDKIPATCDWEGEERETYSIDSIVARNFKWSRETLTFTMTDWCAFIGIYLSEGSTFSDARGNYRVVISQKKLHIRKQIEALLQRMGLTYHYDANPGNYVINSKVLFDYCRQFGLCHEKFVPRDLMGLTKPLLQTLVDWLVKGDGNINCNDTLSYASTSRRLIDDFQELMIKLGQSGNIRTRKNQGGMIRGRQIESALPLYVFNRRKSKFKYFKDTHESYISQVPYQGTVWCLQAGSHVIKVRRNGFEAWCGNSLVGTTPVGMTFSEAALGDPMAYAFFRPILLENNGWSVHISSTRGRNHFYKLFKTYEGQPDAFTEVLSAEDTGIFTALQLAMERKVYIDLYGSAIGNALFEQEFLSSWDAAIIGSVFGSELKRLRKEGRALPLRYDPRYPVDTSWDIGVGDTNVILFWQRVGNFERLFDWYASSDTGIEHYAEILASKPYFYLNHIGPHDIENREWGTNGVGRMATAKKLGVHFKRMPKYSKGDSIACGARLINMMQINVADDPVDDPMDDCAFILDAFEQYHFKFDRERKVMSRNPEHDWTSHYSDALMTRGLFVAEDTTLGRPLALQGRGVDLSAQQYDQTRIRDIFARQNRKRTGAWG